MRRLTAILAAALLLSSCGMIAPNYGPLYYWGGEQNGTTTYENLAYKDYKTQSPEAICSLVCAYEKIVSNPGGSRQVPPPGICAEYGYLLLQPTTAQYFINNATPQQRKSFNGSDYGAMFSQRGVEMLEREIELYPESMQFVRPILEKLAK